MTAVYQEYILIHTKCYLKNLCLKQCSFLSHGQCMAESTVLVTTESVHQINLGV